MCQLLENVRDALEAECGLGVWRVDRGGGLALPGSTGAAGRGCPHPAKPRQGTLGLPGPLCSHRLWRSLSKDLPKDTLAIRAARAWSFRCTFHLCVSVFGAKGI